MRFQSGKRFEFRRWFGRKPKNRFEVTFGRGAYEPGDTVSGTIRPLEKMRSRELRASLAYVEQSSDYFEDVEVAETGALRKGRLSTATEAPFTMRLPADALPDWIPDDPDLAEKARLYWAVVVTATRWGPLPDRVERHELSLSTDRSKWRGPPSEATSEEATGSPKSWDVALTVDRPSARRGEEARASITIDTPSPDRTGLEIALVCDVHYDVEQTTSTGTSTTTSRETRTETAYEERIALDPTAPFQEIRLTVPEDGPFTYGEREVARLGPITFGESTGRGSAVVTEWRVEAREDRRLWRDSHRRVPLQVLP